MCVSVYACMYVSIHACMYVCIGTAYVHTCKHTHIHTYIHTYISYSYMIYISIYDVYIFMTYIRMIHIYQNIYLIYVCMYYQFELLGPSPEIFRFFFAHPEQITISKTLPLKAAICFQFCSMTLDRCAQRFFENLLKI